MLKKSLLLFALVLSMSAPAYAQEDATVTAARQIIQSLALPTPAVAPAPEPTVPTVPTETPTNWAQVTDKYADKLLNGLGSIAGKVEDVMVKTAPTIWNALVRKQIAVAVAGLIAPFVILALFIYLAWFMKSKSPDDFQTSEGWTWMKWVLPGLLLGTFLIVAVAEVYTSLPRLISPEWYAIQDIVDAVSNILHGSATSACGK